MEIGAKIRQLRKSKKLLQKELGAGIGVTAEAVSFWENGIRMPRPRQIRKLADFFGVSEEELFILDSRKIYQSKDVNIPIVCSIGTRDEYGRSDFRRFDPPYKNISFSDCKGMVLDTNALAPVAYKGQEIIFSETEPVKNGDIVFVKFKKGERHFKRYFKNKEDGKITLQNVSPSLPGDPMLVSGDEIDFCRKVVGIRF